MGISTGDRRARARQLNRPSPGPWRRRDGRGWSIFYDRDGRYLGRLDWDHDVALPVATAQGNTRAMRAAGEMYALLQRLVAAVEIEAASPGPDNVEYLQFAVVRPARALLRKIDGREDEGEEAWVA